MIPLRNVITGISLLLLTVGLVSLGGVAEAVDKPVTFNLGPTAPPKDMAHIGTNQSFDMLEGGETIGSAIPIPGLPFADTGATCDNVDDYDEVCPYSGSTSPDVVYSFTPAGNVTVRIDMLGSSYDTKVFVYDAGLALVACNDDFYPDYTAAIEMVALTGGATYYIVVDGYGGDCGDYLLTVTGTAPCMVSCPAGAMPEGEPPLVDGYQDHYNGGCNSTPAVFQILDEANVCPATTLICGVSGWFYDSAIGDVRDTDWYVVTVGASGIVEVTVEAEYNTYLFELGPHDCGLVNTVQDTIAYPCVPTTMQIPGAPGSTVWFWVGPTTFSGPVHEYPYVLTVTGHEVPPIADDPPEITVDLNRDCLWPPNHKMADIIATVTVTDDCCPNPTFVLSSITSNEPDNGLADGNTDDDIQGAAIGTADTQFQLRSERSGQGDGRFYTIVYTASDCSGNSTSAMVQVRVPHDQAGGACASMGYSLTGLGLDPGLSEFALVIRSSPGFDATALDIKKTYVGNVKGVTIPTRSMEIDNNADGRMDLAVFYSARALSVLRDEGAIGLHYRSKKEDYLVPDIFGLGEPVPLVPTVVIPRRTDDDGDRGRDGIPAMTTLLPSYPNPFNPSTTIPFNLVSAEWVTLRIYNAQGALVRTLRNENFPAGAHRVIWDGHDKNGRDVATGAYFVRFTAGEVENTRKVVLIR